MFMSSEPESLPTLPTLPTLPPRSELSLPPRSEPALPPRPTTVQHTKVPPLPGTIAPSDRPPVTSNFVGYPPPTLREQYRRMVRMSRWLWVAGLVTVMLVGFSRLRSRDAPPATEVTKATTTAASSVVRANQSHSVTDNSDGSISVVEGRARFWFPAHGVRSVPTDVADGAAAVYAMPAPSTVEVIVVNYTFDSTGDEQAVATRFMTPLSPTKWMLANWQPIASPTGKAFSVDMILPDQQVIHVRLFVSAFSTIAVQARATDTAAPPLLDHIWSSLAADTHPSI